MNPQTFLEFAGAVLALILTMGGAAAMLWAISKVRGVEASIGILNEANSGLREANTDLAGQLSRDRDHFQQQLHQQEKECNAAIARQEKECVTAIAKLEGQVETLTGSLADRIVQAINVRIESKGPIT